MTPADPTPVPPHLSDAERALWEKATFLATHPRRSSLWFDATEQLRDFEKHCSPEFILSLLTALASEREAGERARKDAERLDWLTRRMESCDDGVYAWGIIGLDPSIPSLRDAIDTASENDNA